MATLTGPKASPIVTKLMKLIHLEEMLSKTINHTIQQEDRIKKFMNKSGRKEQLVILQQMVVTTKPKLQMAGITEIKNKLVEMQGIIGIQRDNQQTTINMEEPIFIRNQQVGIGLTELVITTTHASITNPAIANTVQLTITAAKLNKLMWETPT